MAGPSKADAQRQRVLSASAEIFSRRGYRATSMNEIAAEVGLSKPTLYHYFRRKEDILVRLYENVMGHILTSAQAIAAAAPSPIAALRQLITYRVRYTCENQALHKLFFEEEAELPPAMLRTVLQRRREFENILKSAVLQHLAATGITLPTTPTVYVNTCLGAANWVYKWFNPDGSEDPQTLGQHIATLVLQPLLNPVPVPDPDPAAVPLPGHASPRRTG
jgi:TetR/AcrR family transcriptional regulator, cholesterol catabolism regulator